MWETSVGDKCGRQVGDKCKLMQPKAPRVGEKGEAIVNSCGPRNPEWETSVGDKCGRQVWETSVGDKCKLKMFSNRTRALYHVLCLCSEFVKTFKGNHFGPNLKQCFINSHRKLSSHHIARIFSILFCGSTL